jgi:hypothetical protein
MYEDYINQLAYLNELHSSFVQWKLEWLDAKSKIYIPWKIWNHYDMVWNNSLDSSFIDSLLLNLQKIHCLRYALSEQLADLETLQRTTDILPEEFRQRQVIFMTDCIKETISTTWAIIWTSRSVSQASHLVNKYWNEYIREFMVDYVSDAEFYQKKYFQKESQ